MILKITKSIVQTFGKYKRNLLSVLFLLTATITHAQFPAPYCDFTLTYDWEPITLVNFAGINQTSDSTTVTAATATNQGLTNYLSDTGTVAPGFTYNSILKGNTHGSYTNYFTIFIDWNQNGSLSDAGESYNVGTVASSTGLDAIQATGSVLVPANALLGNTRMRIVKRFTAYTTTPCASTWGAAQDYIIKVVPPPCVAPTVIYTIAPNCSNGQFSINVNITNMGSATSIGIGDGTTTFATATATGNYTAGPFTSGATKTITLTHNNALCNVTSSAQTYTCPPLNDEALGAIALTVNADLNCTATTAGSTISSTQSADVAPSCSATGINDDVWYKFTATASGHQFKFTSVTSGTMAVALYTGTPGALVGTTDCGSGATVNFFDLVPNTQYYARMYTTTATTTTTTNFTVCLGTVSNMSYDSTTTTQASSSTVLPGAADQQILGIRVYTSGGSAIKNATKFDFTTSGTMTSGDASNAKVYSTGSSSTFATTTLFGTAVANPNGSFSVIGNQALNPVVSGISTNYFWLVYDIGCAPTVGHTVDAVCNGVTVSSVLKTATVSDPTGTRTINAATAPTYTTASGTSVALAGQVSMGRTGITGDNCNVTVTGVKFNTSTSPVADIATANCYYTTSTTFATTTSFGTAVVNPNGDITFTGSQTLAAGTGNYFWLAYTVACSATLADSLIAVPVSITTNAGLYSVATPSTNTKKGIIAPTSFNTVADGDWSSSSTWACGNVPTSTSNVNVNNAVTVSTSGNVASNVTISSGATLTIASGDLTMGATGGDKKVFTCNGTLTVTGGTFNINGNMLINAAATFNQSGGNVNVDGNAAGVTANSVASGTYIVNIASQNLNWTAGTFTIVDPHAASGTNYAFYYNNSIANVELPATHTFAFGNGVSADAAASTNGFYVNIWPGSNRMNFGSITINGPSTGNRFVTTAWSTAIHGDLLITNGGELRTTSAVNVTGNLTVNANSYYTCTTTLGLLNYTGTATTASTNPQTISGAGTFRNAATSPTANFASLTVNNTNSAGVTFADANSLLSGANTGTVSGTLTMTAGKVNVGANTLILGVSAATTGTYTYTGGKIIGNFKRWVGASTGDRSFDIGTGNVGRKVSINFTAAPTTGGSLTAKWNSGNPGSSGLPLTEGSNTYTNTSQNGYWTVSTGDGLTGGTYTVAMTLTGGSDAPDYSTVTIGKRPTSGDAWALVGTAVAPTGSASNFTVSRTGVTGFSDFVILMTSTPLSVKLSSFTGRNAGAVNILNWKTATEKDASHFDVLRSNDGNKFEKLSTVNAKNVLTGSLYEFTDNKPFDGKNFYRLNMMDVNGKSAFSDVVVLSVKSSAGLTLVASPNPVNQTLNLSINGKIDGKATIQVVDITGKIVQKIQVSSNDTGIDMSALASGTYIIRYNDNSNSSVIKVTKN